MPVNNADVGPVVQLCQQHHQRVRYGVLGAAISTRVGNPNAQPQNYAQATVAMINAFFGGIGPAASWVVEETGFPTGYGAPPNANFDPHWSTMTPLHNTVAGFLVWLDSTAPGWDANLQSTYP
ncbi:hypothetical protein J8F10_12455 [Gemmata sp. G18]|uniref:Uncharacterized protein n=1 Tax=Gemmata palustris TaxID=2822762 RepID=A0ABS5BQT2_9BACT|nr:hypothetical protein [Gemmata palustris]MBP3956094.1 hypothetical protein [Gemmata palustris]